MWTTPECRHVPVLPGSSLLRNGDFGRGIWSIRCIGGGGIFCRSFFRRGGCSWGRQCSAEIIRQNVLGAADVHGKQIRCNLGHPAQPGGGAGWAAGRAPSGSRLRMHRAVLFQATKKSSSKSSVRCQNLPLRHRDPPTGRQAVPPGESPLVPHSAAAAFQRPAVRGWIPAPRSRRTQRVPHYVARQGCPAGPAGEPPAPGGGSGKA